MVFPTLEEMPHVCTIFNTSAHVQESSFPEPAHCMDFPPHSVLFQYSTRSTTFSVLILTAGNL